MKSKDRSSSSSSKKWTRKEAEVHSLAWEDLILKALELPIISRIRANETSARARESFLSSRRRLE